MRDARIPEFSQPMEGVAEEAARRGRQLAVADPDVDRLLSHDDDRELPWREFFDAFLLEAGKNAACVQRWAEALARDLTEHTAQEGLDDDDGDSHERLLRAWASPPKTRQDDERILGAAICLLQLDPARGLRALEGLPNPLFVWEFATASLKADPELIARLVFDAPYLIDDAGAIRERPYGSLVPASLIVEYATALLHVTMRRRNGEGPNEQEAREKLVAAELKEWMTTVCGRLLERTDGHLIASAYAAHLSENVLASNNKEARERAEVIALEVLVQQLAQVDGSYTRLYELWQREQSREARSPSSAVRDEGEGAQRLLTSGTSFLWAAVLIIRKGPSLTTSNDVDAWSWFEALLVERDPGLDIVGNDNASARLSKAMAELLARLPSSRATFDTSYRKLEAQRRRATFGYRYSRDDGNFTSRVLLLVGLWTLVHEVELNTLRPGGADAESRFFELFDRARRLWLTRALVSDRELDIVAYCFAFLPAIGGPKRDAMLQRALPLVASNAKLLVQAAARMDANGMAIADFAEHLREASPDTDLPEAIRTLSVRAEKYRLPASVPQRFIAWADAQLTSRSTQTT